MLRLLRPGRDCVLNLLMSDCSLVAGCLQEPRGQGGDPLQLLPSHFSHQTASARAQEEQAQGGTRGGANIANGSSEHGTQRGSVLLLLFGSCACPSTSASTFLLCTSPTSKVRGLPCSLSHRAGSLETLSNPLAIAHDQSPDGDAGWGDQSDWQRLAPPPPSAPPRAGGQRGQPVAPGVPHRAHRFWGQTTTTGRRGLSYGIPFV